METRGAQNPRDTSSYRGKNGGLGRRGDRKNGKGSLRRAKEESAVKRRTWFPVQVAVEGAEKCHWNLGLRDRTGGFGERLPWNGRGRPEGRR